MMPKKPFEVTLCWKVVWYAPGVVGRPPLEDPPTKGLPAESTAIDATAGSVK